MKISKTLAILSLGFSLIGAASKPGEVPQKRRSCTAALEEYTADRVAEVVERNRHFVEGLPREVQDGILEALGEDTESLGVLSALIHGIKDKEGFFIRKPLRGRELLELVVSIFPLAIVHPHLLKDSFQSVGRDPELYYQMMKDLVPLIRDGRALPVEYRNLIERRILN